MRFTSSSLIIILLQVFNLAFVTVGQEISNKTSGILLNNSSSAFAPSNVLYITGGTPSIYGEFPFMAALGWMSESGDLKYHGGGMLINPKMILTAAHCVYKNGKLPDTIYVGGNPLSNNNTFENVFSIHTVNNVTIFPGYDPNQGYDDIAILELNEPSWYQPVCLWAEPEFEGDEVTAIGYGLTEFAGSGSPQLLKVNLTVFTPEYCEPFFKRQRKFKSGLTTSHICAGDKDGVKDTCQGDSGGPIIIDYNYRKYAVGITSSGQACSGFPPAIYTKIYSYIEWIKDVLRERDQLLGACIGTYEMYLLELEKEVNRTKQLDSQFKHYVN